MKSPLASRFARRSQSPRVLASVLPASLVFLAALPTIRAQTSSFTATSPNPADYQLPANWNNGVPNAVGASALFSTDIPANTFTVNLNGAVTLGNLTLGDANSATNGFYNIQNGTGGSLTFSNTTGNATLTKTTGIGSTDTVSATVALASTLAADVRTGAITISGVISGVGGIIRSGSVVSPIPATTAGGTLNLTNNNNSYAGTTTIEQGTLNATLSGDVGVSVNSVLGNSATAVVVGLSTTPASGTGSSSTLNFTANNDTNNYTMSRGIDFSQGPSAASGATVNFNSDGAGAVNTNTLTLAGAMTFGARLAQITAQRTGMTVNITGDITSAATGGNLRLNTFPANPSVDGRGSGTVRFSNLNRTYGNATFTQSIQNGTVLIDGVVPAAATASPIGVNTLSLALGSGGNIVGAANFNGGAAIQDTSPDTIRSVFLETAGSSFGRVLGPGGGSISTPAAGGYTTAVNVFNGYQFGGRNTVGTVTFSGNITPGDVQVGNSPTNVITLGTNMALIAENGGTAVFSGVIGDTPSAATNSRVTINQFRNHPNLDGNNGTTVNSDGVIDAAANQLVGTARTGTVILSGANTYAGGTEVLGGRLLVNGGVFNAATPASTTSGTGSGAVTVTAGTLGGTGAINVGANTVNVNTGAFLSPGAPGTPGMLTVVGTQTGTPLATGTGTLNLNTGSTFAVKINGLTAGSGYDQLNVVGTVALGGGNLTLTLGGFTAPGGSMFTIVSNDGNAASDLVFGTFAQGATVTADNGQIFAISYVGGDGNDIVLTAAVPEPSTYALLGLGLGAMGLGLARRRRQAAAV